MDNGKRGQIWWCRRVTTTLPKSETDDVEDYLNPTEHINFDQSIKNVAEQLSDSDDLYQVVFNLADIFSLIL